MSRAPGFEDSLDSRSSPATDLGGEAASYDALPASPLGFPGRLAPYFSPPPYSNDEDVFRLKPMITPHPEAPLFSRVDSGLMLSQVLEEVASGNFPATESFLEIMRQASLVSLWFFLKTVASFSGAYTKINEHLHLEMCNFRQLCLEPGIHAAILTPRGSFKSTIADHGANPWEIARDPDVTIGIFSATFDKAQEFYLQSKSIMENALYRELWPEIVPMNFGSRGSEWSDSSLCASSRRLRKATPTLAPYTASGSVSGTHVGVGIFDDIVTDAMLNAGRYATAEMIEKTNWFKSNIDSLREEPLTSRSIDIGTRYSLEDPHEITQKNSCYQFGDWTEVQDLYPRRPGGQWWVYYRSAKAHVEDRVVSIQPQAYSIKFLDDLAERDPWTYNWQYANHPTGSGTSEFSSYNPPECVFTEEGIQITNTDEFVRFEECDITIAIDPAGSDHRVSVRTSQTAMIVCCRDTKNRKFLFGRKGYVKTTKWFDWMFAQASFFGDLLSRTVIEQVSGFKNLDSFVLREQYDRGIRLHYRPIGALGDKDSTIKMILQPEFEKGLVFIDRKTMPEFVNEMRAFPGGSQKDFLDAAKIAIKTSKSPEWRDSKQDARERGFEIMAGAGNNTAY